MFVIRQSKPEDVATLLKLARTVYFINLPPNEAIIGSKIEHSARCLRRLVGLDADGPRGKGGGKIGKGAGASANGSRAGASRGGGGSTGRGRSGGGLAGTERDSDLFMFTILEPEAGSVVGTSQVRSHMGGLGNPNWRMRVSEKRFHSASLGFGTTHTVARLDGDESGPTEIGGLILDPGFRGHRLRPGRFLSFVRFHFMGLQRASFANTVLAEMMAPVTSEGDNAFWDAFGRKFIPVKYAEADRFCQHNRAFISELLPKDEVYLTLLPLEVQNMVGVVSRETIPARRLLESLGFAYRGFIDPFDGGPHLDAQTDEIPLIKATRHARLGAPTDIERCRHAAIVSVLSPEGEFRATEAWCEVLKDGTVRTTRDAMDLIGGEDGGAVGVTLLGKFGPRLEERPGASGAKVAVAGKKRAKR